MGVERGASTHALERVYNSVRVGFWIVNGRVRWKARRGEANEEASNAYTRRETDRVKIMLLSTNNAHVRVVQL